MPKANSTVVITFSIAMFVLLIILLVLTYNSKCKLDNSEPFEELLTNEEIERRARIKAETEEKMKAKKDEYNAMYNPQGSSGIPNNLSTYAPPMNSLSLRAGDGIEGSDPLGNSSFGVADATNANLFMETQIAGSCVSRDRLTSADLLPLDANSKWADLNPQCSGDLQDQNYLTAGYHIGINTVGQSMKNASLDIRREPPNPQLPVSPWGISTTI
jgi:hypothetical protein